MVCATFQNSIPILSPFYLIIYLINTTLATFYNWQMQNLSANCNTGSSCCTSNEQPLANKTRTGDAKRAEELNAISRNNNRIIHGWPNLTFWTSSHVSQWWSSHKTSVIHLSSYVRFSGHSLFRFSPALCHLISYIRRVNPSWAQWEKQPCKGKICVKGLGLKRKMSDWLPLLDCWGNGAGTLLQEHQVWFTRMNRKDAHCCALQSEFQVVSFSPAEEVLLAGLKRSGKSCRLRWLNYLRPDLKRCQISAEEEQIILQLHKRWGNK